MNHILSLGGLAFCHKIDRNKVKFSQDYSTYTRLRIHSHLRFIRHELLGELFSPGNHKK